MKSKVSIHLGVNNSLEPVHWQNQSITRSVWRVRFTWVRGLLDRDGYRKWLCFRGVPRHKKRKESRIVECSWNSVKKLILCVLRFDSHPKKSLSVIRLCVLFVLLFTRDMRLTQLILTKLVGFRGTPLILRGVYLQMTFC
jgi:hypothetical protein